MIQWPGQRGRRAELGERGESRILLVDRDASAPVVVHMFWGGGLFATYGDAFVDAAATEVNLYTPSGLLVGVLIVAAWVITTTGILFAAMKSTIGIRVSRQEEIDGLDIHEHGAPGYGPDVLSSSSSALV